jgi:Tfp pilus assembly protein PilO
MKVESSTRTIAAILVVAAAAVAFWMLLLSPKMKEKNDLGTQVEGLQTGLSQAQAEVTAGEQAKHHFPKNYQQLVLLGKAVPLGDDTASLIVQTNTIANQSHSNLDSIELTAAGSGGESEAATTAESAESASSSPTEAEAALLPLGATVGSEGLGVMPYNLLFTGSFFHIADFIHGIDSLVKTESPDLSVDGRLITINGFSLAESNSGFPNLEAHFSVNTYVAPPGQSLTGSGEPAPVPTAEGEAEAGGEEPSETTEGELSASTTGEPK